MTRVAAREVALHVIFGMGFTGYPAEEASEIMLSDEEFNSLTGECDIYDTTPDDIQREYIQKLVRGVGLHMPELDTYIDKYSKQWKFERISRIAIAIMRMCMYEVMYMPEVPNAAAINAAIELAKKYEEPSAVSFINGIMGTFTKEELI